MLWRDIRARWSRFSEIDVGFLNSEADLVTQIVAKYSVARPRAEAEAKALLNGRKF